MHLRSSSSEPQIHGIAPGSVPASPDIANPHLSENLRADYEALQNDMEQARELAADFQRQLAGKSNEFAQLKQLFEKTTVDLAALEAGIVELRAERHRMANEAMRARAYEVKLAKVTTERDQLQQEVHQLRAQSGEEMERALRERDAVIAALVVEAEAFKEVLAAAQLGNKDAKSGRGGAAAPQQAARESAPAKPQADAGDEFIEISFSA